jgi:hypothetical protein
VVVELGQVEAEWQDQTGLMDKDLISEKVDEIGNGLGQIWLSSISKYGKSNITISVIFAAIAFLFRKNLK